MSPKRLSPLILGDTKSRTHVALVVIDVLGDTKSRITCSFSGEDVLGDTKSRITSYT